MPEGVDELIVGDGVAQYRKIRDVERRLDSVMMRKRLDMQDKYVADQMPGGTFSSSGGRTKRMKIWISNTVENQPWQGGGMDESAFDFTMGTEASYKVKIQGQLMDGEDSEEAEESESNDQVPGGKAAGEKQKNGEDAMDTEPDGQDAASRPSKPPQPSRPSQQKTKLSHFFKSITVDFDRNKNLQPQGMTQVEWKKPPMQPNTPILPPAADFDSLEFERKSDENINCTINFYRDESPERYLLDKPLSELLDTTEDDRTSIVMGIWEYIKAMGLQQSDEKRQIHCDDRLRAVSHCPVPTPSVFTDSMCPGLWPGYHLLPAHQHHARLSPLPSPPIVGPLHHPRRSRISLPARSTALHHLHPLPPSPINPCPTTWTIPADYPRTQTAPAKGRTYRFSHSSHRQESTQAQVLRADG